LRSHVFERGRRDHPARDLPANIAKCYLEGASTSVTPAGIDMVQTINEIEKRTINEALQLSRGVKARGHAEHQPHHPGRKDASPRHDAVKGAAAPPTPFTTEARDYEGRGLAP